MEVQITGKVQRSWELSLDHSWKRGGGRDVDREKKERYQALISRIKIIKERTVLTC